MFHKKVFVWEDMKQGRYDMFFPYGRDICEQECIGYWDTSRVMTIILSFI